MSSARTAEKLLINADTVAFRNSIKDAGLSSLTTTTVTCYMLEHRRGVCVRVRPEWHEQHLWRAGAGQPGEHLCRYRAEQGVKLSNTFEYCHMLERRREV